MINELMQTGGPVVLSVIVPVYNAMDCLEKCINSIRRQTMTNLEIIIVDDGSTDNTGALCEKLAMMDKRIRVFHKENGGSSSARNVGIDNAVGEYLGFVDADDYIEPLMYERLLSAAMQTNLLMIQTSRDEINEDGTRREDVCTPPEKSEIFDTLIIMRELLLHRGDCSFCTRLTHKSLFENLRFPEGELNEDFYLLVQMLPKIKKVAVLPYQDYHVFYRMQSNSRTKDENYFPRVFSDIVVNADRVSAIVEKSYPVLVDEAFRFGMFQRLDYMLHIPIIMMNSHNKFYKEVKKYLRKNKYKALNNRFLTKKNKQYIFILGTAPKLARKIHRIKMKGNKENAE
ncbi:MAG: glycosyltransferase [Lachnospiraceae bacterium]|nr:glycosyltransferase [Lachnospiraceae bacterium]